MLIKLSTKSKNHKLNADKREANWHILMKDRFDLRIFESIFSKEESRIPKSNSWKIN